MAELTVPRAGIDPGRSSTVRVEPSTVGSDIAQFGQVMASVGQRLEGDRLEREMGRLSIDLTKDMNAMRLDLAEIGDPDQLEAAYQSRVGELRQSYSEGQNEEGRARVDPRNKDKFLLAFDDLAARQEFAIGSQALAGRFAQREATFIEYAHTAASSAVTADLETRELMFEKGLEQIRQLEANGIIDAATASKRSLALRGSLDEAAAIAEISDDPEGFLEADEAGEYPGLAGDTRARFILTANNRIASATAKAQKEHDIALNTQSKAVGDRLDEMSGIWNAGQRAVDEDAFLQRPEVQSHPKFAKAMAQKQLLDEQPALEMMTVDQLAQLTEEEKRRPKAFKFQAERLSILEHKLEAEKTAWAKDPIAQARAKALGVPDVPEFDPENPDTFTAGLTTLRHYSSSLVEGGWTDEDAVFSQDDIASLKAQISSQTDPSARADMAKSVVTALGDRRDLIGLVADDAIFQYVGALQVNKGSPRLASEILTGQQAISDGTVLLPPVKDRLAPTFDAVESLFLDIPGGTKIQSDVMQAADALYGARMGRVDPTDDINESVYEQALHEVLGGSGAYGSSRAKGGVQEIGDHLTMLPMGVGTHDVEAALGALGRREVESTGTGQGSRAKQYRVSGDEFSGDLAAISVSGLAPEIGGEPLSMDMLERMSIRAVRDGVYEFFHVDNIGRVLVPETSDGTPYRFDMRALLKGGKN